MGHNIDFSPISEFGDWLDGVDRVTASGDNGFNVRFRSLQADLQTLAARVEELNTAINHDQAAARLGLATLTADGVVDDAFRVFATHFPIDNDFVLTGGSACISGVAVFQGVDGLQYALQPWTDPAQAAADGVPVIPPLTTPQADRQDTVYLDAWEREAEIDGIRRLVGGTAVRVQEGGQPPSPLPGHLHLRLAVLNRQAGNGRIDFSQIEDARAPIDRGPTERVFSPPPLFHPETAPGWEPWKQPAPSGRLSAAKAVGDFASGFLPINVPSGARALRVTVAGDCGTAGTGPLELRLRQRSSTGMTFLAVESIEFLERGTFLQALEAPAGTVIDNDESYLFLHAWSGGSAALEIIQIRVYYLA